MENYRMVKELGGGSQSQTHVVERKRDGRSMCMKTIQCKSPEEVNQALHEAKMIKENRHASILGFEEVIVNEGNVAIVTELCSGGDLSKYMMKIKKYNRKCPEFLAADYLYQISSALAHLHKKRILHRDIKPHNIFLGNNDIVKLGDFGIATVGESSNAHAGSPLGTPLYVAPEVRAAKEYTAAGDVWGLGCIAYELLSKDLQFENYVPGLNNFLSMRVKSQPITPDCMPSSYSLELRALVCSMLALRPEDRPTASTCAWQLSQLSDSGKGAGCFSMMSAPSAPGTKLKKSGSLPDFEALFGLGQKSKLKRSGSCESLVGSGMKKSGSVESFFGMATSEHKTNGG